MSTSEKLSAPQNIERMTTHVTIAEAIANALGNDGMAWRTAENVSFDALIAQHGGAHRDHNERPGTEMVRYRFCDGSIITGAGAAWDIGFSDCWCWAGAGHQDNCESIRSA